MKIRRLLGGWNQIGGGKQRLDLHLAIHPNAVVEPHAFRHQRRHFLDHSLAEFHVATELRFDHDELDGRADATGLESHEPPESSDVVTDQQKHLLSAQALSREYSIHKQSSGRDFENVLLV
jgi:hypothetical protein